MAKEEATGERELEEERERILIFSHEKASLSPSLLLLLSDCWSGSDWPACVGSRGDKREINSVCEKKSVWSSANQWGEF